MRLKSGHDLISLFNHDLFGKQLPPFLIMVFVFPVPCETEDASVYAPGCKPATSPPIIVGVRDPISP
jgi:hypothetical protein